MQTSTSSTALTRVLRAIAPATVCALTFGVLAGCGGDDSASSAPTTAKHSVQAADPTTASSTPPTTAAALDPCQLLNQQEATAAAGGVALQAGVPAGPAGTVVTCTYTSDPNGETAQVMVTVGDGAKKIMDVDKNIQHVFTKIPGVGDEAWEEDDAAFVRKGQNWVALNLVRLNDPAADRVPLENALKVVVSRLP